MTVVRGTFKDVAGSPAQGRVIVASVMTRPAQDAQGVVVVTARHVIPLVDGEWRTPELDPGVTLVEVEASGTFSRWEIDVPLEGEHDFATLFDKQVDYSPEAVAQAWEAAASAQAAAEQAQNSASVVGSAEAVLSAAEAAEVSRSGAEDARGAAAASAAAAALSEAAARSAEVDARAHNNNASASESAAAASKSAAAASATAAAQSESASAQSATAADGARVAAEAARDAAAGSASAASGSASEADTSASEAAQSATAAAGSATAAEAAAGTAAGEVRGELSDLVSTASGHASAAADSAAAAAQSAADAASVVSDGVADASTSIKGKVRLAGDLAGTADNPSVPGLATKADKGHTHPVAEVTGLATALDGKVDKVSAANRLYGTNGSGGQSSWPLAGLSVGEATVPLRTTGGAIVAGSPTAANHAATKAYTDRRPALFSGAGAPPSSIPGAVVGDWWLNETTMELSKITGV